MPQPKKPKIVGIIAWSPLSQAGPQQRALHKSTSASWYSSPSENHCETAQQQCCMVSSVRQQSRRTILETATSSLRTASENTAVQKPTKFTSDGRAVQHRQTGPDHSGWEPVTRHQNSTQKEKTHHKKKKINVRTKTKTNTTRAFRSQKIWHRNIHIKLSNNNPTQQYYHTIRLHLL